MDLHVLEGLVFGFELFAVNNRGQAHAIANAHVKNGRDRVADADVDAEFKEIERVNLAEVGGFDIVV